MKKKGRPFFLTAFFRHNFCFSEDATTTARPIRCGDAVEAVPVEVPPPLNLNSYRSRSPVALPKLAEPSQTTTGREVCAIVFARRSRWRTDPRGTPKLAEPGLMVRRRVRSHGRICGEAASHHHCLMAAAGARRHFGSDRRIHHLRNRIPGIPIARLPDPSIAGRESPVAVTVRHPAPGIARHPHVAGAGVEGPAAILERAPVGADEVGLPDKSVTRARS